MVDGLFRMVHGGEFDTVWWMVDGLILDGVWLGPGLWMVDAGRFDPGWWMVDGLILDGG